MPHSNINKSKTASEFYRSNTFKSILLLLIISIFLIVPAPETLNPVTWRILGVYLAIIAGLILQPFKEPVLLLIGLAVSALILSLDSGGIFIIEKDLLNGYSSTTIWLIFTAFFLSTALVVTGLGKRIAYMTIKKVGKTTLTLGYINVFIELLLSPITPSNSARAGGIVAPIMNGIATALKSTPENPQIGKYLLLNVYMVTKTTSYMFLTGMAGNALALEILAPALGVRLTWMQWLGVSIVPGLVCLFLTPLVVYFLCPPGVKHIDKNSIVDEGLKELGPVKKKEITLCMIFLMAIFGWIFADTIGIHVAYVGLIAMALLFVLNIITWDDALNSKGAWNIFIWYGGILCMTSLLQKGEFFVWLGGNLNDALSVFEIGPVMGLILVLSLSVVIRYLFVSGGAYVASMLPVFAMIGQTFHIPLEILAVALLFSNGYGGCTTHYGSGPGPIIMGYGFNDIKSWWIVGAVIAFGSLIIHLTIGVAWWRFILPHLGF